MRVTDKKAEGYHPLYETKEKGVEGLTADFLHLIRTRDPEKRKRIEQFEATLKQVILDPNSEDGIDLEALEKQPLFELHGFQGHPPEVHEPGEEPAASPMSKEQMRLLLVSILPASMIPFVLERVVFEYQPTLPDEPGGPIVKVVRGPDDKQRVHITLRRNDFITKAPPPDEVQKSEAKILESLMGDRQMGEALADKNLERRGMVIDPLDPAHISRALAEKEAQARTKIVGFVDPSRISLYMGKILAEMIPPPPPDDPRVAETNPLSRWQELVNLNFAVTSDKDYQRRSVKEALRAKLREPGKEKEKRLLKQWKDFVGLAITAPELASQKYPEAYRYFLEAADRFNNPAEDGKAVKRIADRALEQGGILELPEIERINDLRTEAEKQEDKGISPELAWYERLVVRLNKGLAAGHATFGKVPLIGHLLGFRLTYTIPEDPDRAEQLAGDDKEVKILLEILDDKMRLKELGQLIASAPDYDKRSRHEARRYLLAISQAGEFTEWPVYAWLYKFSKTFRQWNGQYISEEDYKDLQMIYSQSEKMGNRVGTGVLPYEAITPDEVESRHFGTRKFIYKFKGDAYKKEVAKKIRNKNLSALTDASDKAFDQFKSPTGKIDFNAVFNATPEGMLTQAGNLQEFLGTDLAPEVARFLGQMGVEKISPDAKALAIRYYDYYKERNFRSDRYITPKALEVIHTYKDDLNIPPTETIEALFDIPAKELAESADFDRINEKLAAANAAREAIMKSLGAELAKEQYSSHIIVEVRDKIIDFIDQGSITVNDLFARLDPILQDLYQSSPENIEVARRTIMRFLYDQKTVQNLVLLEKVLNYYRELLPLYTMNIKESTRELTELKPEAIRKIISPKEELTHEELEEYLRLGIKLTEDDLQRIRDADKDLLAAAQAETAKAPVTPTEQPEVSTDIRDNSPAKNQTRATILAEKLTSKKTDPLLRERFVVTTAEQALGRLRKAFIYIEIEPEEPETEAEQSVPVEKKPLTLGERYQAWLSAPENQIFQLPALRSLLDRITFAMTQATTDDPRTQAYGLHQVSEITADIARAVNFEKSYLETIEKERRQPRQREQPRPQRERREREEEAEEEAA